MDLLAAWAPRVADALGRIQINYKKPVVDIEDGIENTTSGPAVVFTVNPAAAAKAGFTTDQLTTVASAIVDGEPATAPVIIDDKPYTLRVRYPAANRSSLEAMNNTVIVNANGGSATLGSVSTVNEVPGQTEILRDNLQRKRKSRRASRASTWARGIAAVQKAVNDLHLPPSIRVEYGGTYKEQQKSFNDLVVVLLLALVLIFLVLLFEFRSFSAPLAILSSAILSTSGVFLRAVHHAHRFQRRVLHGLDHGAGHRGQERNSVAGRQSKIPLGGVRSGRSHDPGRTPKTSAHRHDGYGRRGGYATFVARDWERVRKCCSPWQLRSSAEF